MAREQIERNINFDSKRNLYYVTFYYGKDKDTGKYIKNTKTYEDLKTARKALRKHETEMDEGKAVKPKELTLHDWLTQWMNTVVRISKAETTIYAYENILRHMEKDIGTIGLQKLTPQHIQKYYADLILERGLSSNTARKHHDLLNSALKLAVKQDLIARNPVERVEAPNVEQAEIAFYDYEQIMALLEASRVTQLELLIHLAGMLGLRREEALGLTWKAINFDKQELEIKLVRTQTGDKTIEKKPKTKTSRRTLYFPDEIKELLLKERASQEKYQDILDVDYGNDQGFVIIWENGTPLRPNYTSDLFKKFIEDNDLPPITLHGLRHSFASLASANGLPIYDIGRVLGHSNTATTTKIYTHLLDQGHKGMMESLWGKKGDK